MIGIWDAPPLEKTPEELEKERRYKEAVQFGADYDRDPNRMLQKLQQQRRSRDVMGQIDPLTQEIIREQEDKSSGAYLDRPYTPGQRAPVPDSSPAQVGPAAPPRVNGHRALRAIMPPGEEPPMARANVPGVKFQTNAPLNDEGVAELDQQVMARQMAQAEKSSAMRAKVAEVMARQRAANPKQPTLHRVNYMAARGLNPDKTPMEQPIQVPGNEVGANMLSSILRARVGGGRGKSPEELDIAKQRLGKQDQWEQMKDQRFKQGEAGRGERQDKSFEHQMTMAGIRADHAKELSLKKAEAQTALAKYKDDLLADRDSTRSKNEAANIYRRAVTRTQQYKTLYGAAGRDKEAAAMDALIQEYNNDMATILGEPK